MLMTPYIVDDPGAHRVDVQPFTVGFPDVSTKGGQFFQRGEVRAVVVRAEEDVAPVVAALAQMVGKCGAAIRAVRAILASSALRG